MLAVDAGPDLTTTEGAALIGNGSFTAAGVSSAFTATADYGDGTGAQPLTVNLDKTFVLNHIYADNGAYPVSVRVTGPGFDGTDALLATVLNVAPTGTLANNGPVGEGSPAIVTFGPLASLGGLFGTGLGASGVPLAGGAVDPHYRITNTADHNAYAVTALAGGWPANTVNSGWISPVPGGGTIFPPGPYTYETTFTVNGDPARASLSGVWTSDNPGKLYLNGVYTGYSIQTRSWTQLFPFNITDGFVAGVNTLRFEVANADDAPAGSGNANPTGLRFQPNLGTITGSSTDISPVDRAAGLHYAFDLDNNGGFDFGGDGTYAGSGSAFFAAIPGSAFSDGPSARVVRGRVMDKDGGFADFTTTINVVNVAPTANNDAVTVAEDGTAVINVVANDTDPANTGGVTRDPLTVVSAGAAVHGTVTRNANGTITYRPNPNYSGPDRFDYDVSDGDGQTGTGTVLINVTGVADVPTLGATPRVDSSEGVPAILGMSAGLTDLDGSESLAILVSGLPADARLLNATPLGAGVWRLEPWQLAGQQILVLDDATFDVTIQAVATEASNGSTAVSVPRVARVEVRNLAPTVSPLALDAEAIDENGSVSVSGGFVDFGVLDTHSVTVDWGDGSTSAATVDPGTRSFAASHRYLDNLPGDAAYAVGVIVADDDGGVGSATTSVVVKNVAPTPAITGVPAGSPEGASIALAAAVTDPGSADTFTYSWAVRKNGVAYASGAEAGFGFTPDDDGTYVVTLTVKDKDGAVGTDQRTIGVTNVAPTVGAISPVEPTLVGTAIAVSVSASDLAADPLTATWSWGDGTTTVVPVTAGAAGATHTYAAAGLYTVTVSVSDGDGGVTESSLAVQILSPAGATEVIAQELVDLVASGVVTEAQAGALTSKLDAAIQSLARQNATAAVNQLGAFKNQVNALVNGHKMTEEEAAALLDSADAIIAYLQG
jgi:hypothetical protein